MYKTLLFMLVCGFMCCGSGLAEPAENALDPQMFAELQAQLSQWQKNAEKKQQLSGKLRNLDIQSDPDRDDRFWWNPLWYASRENQAQKANELTLEIQKINQEQQELSAHLLQLTTQFSQASLKSSQTLSNAEQALWQQSDAWRIPGILEPLNWKRYSAQQLAAQPEELKQKRLEKVQHKQKEWQKLETYLLLRLDQLNTQDTEQIKYLDWQQQVRKSLEKLNNILNPGNLPE